MTTIKIHKNNKNWLNTYGQGTYDERITQLIDEVEDNLPIIDIDYSVISAIRIKQETKDRLESYKLTDGESYENIIIRMLITQTINTTK